MKRFVLFFLFIFSCVLSNAQIKWDGGGDGVSWDDGNNWVSDVVPGASNDVILDNLAGIAGSYTVNLPGGPVSVTVNSLTITPSGVNNIIFILPNTNTSSTGFMATGAGDAVVLNSGAIFRNSSGATVAGTPVSVTSTNNFRINNGGRYIHNTLRSHTDYLVSRLSSAAGTEDGIFEFDVPTIAAYTLSVSGRTYGHLILSATTAAGSKIYTGSGTGPLTVNGDLEIGNNVTLSYGPNTNTIIINKNCLIRPNGTFNIANSTNNGSVFLKGNLIHQGTITETGTSMGSLFELNGTTNQNISVTGAGIVSNTVIVSMNNAAGATLLTSVILPYNLKLLSGVVTITTGNLLTMTDNNDILGGSATSFINGPFKKVGDDPFIFHIGEGPVDYAPIEISGGGNSTDEFIAQYFRGNPQVIFGPAYENPPIDHMSALEWWTLDRAVGNSPKKVTLNATAYSDATLVAELVVIRWDGAKWRNEGNEFSSGIFSGPVRNGPTPVSNFLPAGTPTPFTFGSLTAFPDNPLPVTLIAFDVSKLSNTKAFINWELAACCSAAAKFEIQRAGTDKDFITIGSVGGSETTRFYDYPDNGVRNGVNYYRLKMIDQDGKITYSRVVAVMNGIEGLLLTSLIPTIITYTASLTIASSGWQKLDVIIVDMQGRIMKRQSLAVSAGNTNIEISTAGLSAGVYQLAGITNVGKTNLIRFIKQ